MVEQFSTVSPLSNINFDINLYMRVHLQESGIPTQNFQEHWNNKCENDALMHFIYINSLQNMAQLSAKRKALGL